MTLSMTNAIVIAMVAVSLFVNSIMDVKTLVNMQGQINDLQKQITEMKND